MPFFTICNIRLWRLQNVYVKFKHKIPHRSFIISFWNAYFEWKQKRAVLVHVSLNANELLLPVPFPEQGCAFTAPTSEPLLKHLFGFDYHVYPTAIMRFKPY